MSMVLPFQEIRRLVGTELGVSDWVLVDQHRINLFAEAADDFNQIHVDEGAAHAAGLPTTIAHGLLTMGLLHRLAEPVVPRAAEMTGGFYYGFDKVRLIRPLLCGSQIRGRFHLLDYFERKPGQWMRVVSATVEIMGDERPALTAETRSVHFIPEHVSAAAGAA